MTEHRGMRLVLIAVLVGAVLLLMQSIRARAGVEFSVESLQVWIAGLGAIGPWVYVGLFAGRHLLVLPTLLMIPLAGLCFGFVGGTLLATLGLVLNGLIVFGITRWGVRKRDEDEARPRNAVAERLDSAGPWVLGSIVAHPTGPLTVAYVGAGSSRISLLAFVVIVLSAGLFRCLLWAFFGATLTDFGSPASLLATGLLAGALVLPIAYQALQRRSSSTTP